MPSRLHSRSGCLRCRSRRKKCDEERPVCRDCSRLGYACIWRGKDHTTVHVLSSSKALSSMYASLRLRSETVDFLPPDSSQVIRECPRHAISSGYPPIRNNTEHHLLMKLSGFLDMLVLSPSDRDHSYTFAAAVQHFWVRDALLAFSAFVSSARTASLRMLAYQYYSTSIANVQKQIMSPDLHQTTEQLLVATLFLGLFEVNNPENRVFPLLHFEAVGRLLDMMDTSPVQSQHTALTLFHRIALESYLYHVSCLSLFYPQTDRYTQLSPQTEEKISIAASQSRKNIIIALDMDIYRVLFGLNVLARREILQSEFDSRMAQLQNLLEAVQDRTTDKATDGAGDPDFRRLNRIAIAALRILMMKVRNRHVLSSDQAVATELATAIEDLGLIVIKRAWTGNFVWIFVILICAAQSPSDVEALHSRTIKIQAGMWGNDLAIMQRIVQISQKKRQMSLRMAASSDGIVRQTDYDTLAMLLNREGVLAD